MKRDLGKALALVAIALFLVAFWLVVADAIIQSKYLILAAGVCALAAAVLVVVALHYEPDKIRCECPIRPADEFADPSAHSVVCPVRRAGDALDGEVRRAAATHPRAFGPII